MVPNTHLRATAPDKKRVVGSASDTYKAGHDAPRLLFCLHPRLALPTFWPPLRRAAATFRLPSVYAQRYPAGGFMMHAHTGARAAV